MSAWHAIGLRALLIAALLLPALSNLGYSFYDAEYIAAAMGAALLAAIFQPLRVLHAAFGLLCVMLYLGLYYGTTQPIMLLVQGTIIAVLAWRLKTSPQQTQSLLATAAAIQILVSAFFVPSARTTQSWKVQAKNTPAIIHLLLDEHAGIAAIPRSAVSKQDLDRFVAAYVARGFQVFTHAYSAEAITPRSIARLFNANEPSPLRNLREPRSYGPTTLLHAHALERLASTHNLDITQMDYVDVAHAVRQTNAVAQLTRYHETIASEILHTLPFTWNERLRLAVGSMMGWWYRGRHSALLAVWLETTQTGRRYALLFEKWRGIYPIISRHMLQQITDRLACCGERGMYMFAHLIYPHFPYIYDADCTRKPIDQWRSKNELHLANAQTAPALRTALYHAHFEQAQCVQRDVFALLDRALANNPNLQDAVLLIHGDHGSRIASPLNKGMRYNQQARDMLGTFFAVRIPGISGRIIDTPVRIDRIYDHLLQRDFRTLDQSVLLEPDSTRGATPYGALKSNR